MIARTIGVVSLVVGLTVINTFAAGKPLKVFILAGQSNMQGQAEQSTLAGMAMDPETKPLYDKLVDASGKPRVCDNIDIADFGGIDTDAYEKHGKLTVGWGVGFNLPSPKDRCVS